MMSGRPSPVTSSIAATEAPALANFWGVGMRSLRLQLAIAAVKNEDSSLGVFQQRSTNDKVRLPVAVKVFASGNGVAKGR